MQLSPDEAVLVVTALNSAIETINEELKLKRADLYREALETQKRAFVALRKRCEDHAGA